MANANAEASNRSELSSQPSADKVRKVIEDICAAAGTSVTIEERIGSGDAKQPGKGRQLHMTYTGERPMPYQQWFKLVDSIDEALDPLGMIDWEWSERSEESDQERMAGWAILPSTGG